MTTAHPYTGLRVIVRVQGQQVTGIARSLDDTRAYVEVNGSALWVPLADVSLHEDCTGYQDAGQHDSCLRERGGRG